MKVLFVTSEIATLYKKGGLGDVSYALPVALSKLGVKVAVAIPYYTDIKVEAICVGQLAVDFDKKREIVFVFRSVLTGTRVPVYLFRHPRLNVYDGDHIAETFAFYSKVISTWYTVASPLLGGPYDILHCNDWHTALVPLLAGETNKTRKDVQTIQGKRAKTILTIHNLLYKGESGVGVALRLGISIDRFHVFTTRLGRAVRFLREGLEHVDIITTVSPTYAKEIVHHRAKGGIYAVLKKRKDRLLGILNGIDGDLWDPRTDPNLPVNYDKHDVHIKKTEIKTHLQRILGLPQLDVPMFGFVGRLESRQKGIGLIAKAIEALGDTPYQLILLGTGQKREMRLFTKLAKKYSHIAFIHTFDERLARRIYAGADIMLVPSKFEPCGLTQMIAMRYGTIPIVRKTGGLADTVSDGKTGFVFSDYSVRALVAKMKEAMQLWNKHPKAWQRMMQTCMKQDFSWRTEAKKYLEVYKKLINS